MVRELTSLAWLHSLAYQPSVPHIRVSSIQLIQLGLSRSKGKGRIRARNACWKLAIKNTQTEGNLVYKDSYGRDLYS